MVKIVILLIVATFGFGELNIWEESFGKDLDNPGYYDTDSKDQKWLSDAKKGADIEIKEQNSYNEKIKIRLKFSNQYKNEQDKGIDKNEAMKKYEKEAEANKSLKWWGFHVGYVAFGSLGTSRVGENYTLTYDDYKLYHNYTYRDYGIEAQLRLYFIRLSIDYGHTGSRYSSSPNKTILSSDVTNSDIGILADVYTTGHNVYGVGYKMALASNITANITMSKAASDIKVTSNTTGSPSYRYYLYYMKDTNFGLFYGLDIGIMVDTSLNDAYTDTSNIVHDSVEGGFLKSAPFVQINFGFGF
jgi:hypothetical protein